MELLPPTEPNNVVDQTQIFALKCQINELLRAHPELKPLQAKIDELMAGAVTQHNRNVILQRLMQDQMNQLSQQLVALKIQSDMVIQALKGVVKGEK